MSKDCKADEIQKIPSMSKDAVKLTKCSEDTFNVKRL